MRHVLPGLAPATVGLLALTLLVGCTSDETQPESTPSPSASPSATPSPAAPTPTTPSPDDETEVPTDESPAPAPAPGDTPGSPAPSPDQPPADSRTAVTPVLTYAGTSVTGDSIEVSGFVAEVIESGGTCTATLTPVGGGTAVEASEQAEPDATTTVCPSITVPLGSLAAGRWDAVLAYGSPTSTGTSAPVSFEVPAS